MRMRSVIEAGKKASPLVNSCIESLAQCVVRVQTMLADMSDVKSARSMEAIAGECVNEMSVLDGELIALRKHWGEFGSALASYKYKAKKARRKGVVDLPGQQKLFDDQDPETSALDS